MSNTYQCTQPNTVTTLNAASLHVLLTFGTEIRFERLLFFEVLEDLNSAGTLTDGVL